MLIPRLLSAAVALPILFLLFIFGPAWLNLGFFSLVALVALFEYFEMAFQEDIQVRRAGIVIGMVLFVILGYGILYDGSKVLFAATFVFSFIAMFFFFLFRPGDMKTIGHRTSSGVFGLVYINIMLLHIVAVYGLPEGWRYLILLLTITFLNDTGGYFAGKAFGKRKFYEKISPNKTWAGSIGGALAGMAGAFVFNEILSLSWSPVSIVVISLVVGYVGQLGDLCESLLKRSYGVKDSGAIIPGHGGILDRIDALMFAAPVLYYFVLWGQL